MPEAQYTTMLREVEELVRELVPAGATLLVATGGDPQLLGLSSRTRDFPAGGIDPDALTGLSAVVHLEAQRALGADYLLVPSSELWRLEDDEFFDSHLRSRYALLADDEDVGLLVRLGTPATVLEIVRRALDASELDSEHDPVLLDWHTGLDLRRQLPSVAVFSPLRAAAELPYLDATIDVVAVPETATELELTEARRVAKRAVVVLGGEVRNAEPAASLHWQSRSRKAVRASVIVSPGQSDEELDACLYSLDETLVGLGAEIVVAEGGSSEALTAAASSARAEFVVLVLRPLAFLPGWLPPLLRTLCETADAGAATGSVYAFDGRALDAHHQYAHPLVEVAPLLLATPRELFLRLGGLRSDDGVAGYGERLRDARYHLYYQPESTAVVLDADWV